MSGSFGFKTLNLEGDGIVENLFHFLWYKDDLDQGPQINIPDTVIYKFRQPAYWYFTAKDGSIKKKSKYNLSSVQIEDSFTRKTVGRENKEHHLASLQYIFV